MKREILKNDTIEEVFNKEKEIREKRGGNKNIFIMLQETYALRADIIVYNTLTL